LFLYCLRSFYRIFIFWGFIASVIYPFLSARLAVTFAKSSVELCAPCNIPASQNRASTSSTNMLLHFTSGGTAFPTLLVTVASHSFLSFILLARIPGTFLSPWTMLLHFQRPVGIESISQQAWTCSKFVLLLRDASISH